MSYLRALGGESLLRPSAHFSFDLPNGILLPNWADFCVLPSYLAPEFCQVDEVIGFAT